MMSRCPPVLENSDETNTVHSGKLTNIAMENGLFEDVFPIEQMGIFQPAMLVYQRAVWVNLSSTIQNPQKIHSRRLRNRSENGPLSVINGVITLKHIWVITKLSH